jgi:enoyl-CoA hydratase/carnithine racemase
MADLEVEVKGALAIVTLNRPEQRNPIKYSMWVGVAERFAELSHNRNIRAVLLTGAGGNFSVGADISEFDRVRSSAEQAAEYEAAVDAASSAIADCAKPTFAVLSGYCLGGACHLAMACDFRVASPSLRFGIPAAKLSIVYGVRSTQRLLALVGLTAAKRILYTAEHFDAAEAHSFGFADHVAGDPVAYAYDMASQISANAPLSIAGAKEILTALTMGQGSLDEGAAQSIINRAADSEDYQEGRRAFLEKRRPMFRGL